MAVTSKGITYPTSSDNIAPLETHFANLANTADNIGAIAGRESFTGPDATGSTMDVEVAFASPVPQYTKVTANVETTANGSCYAVTLLGSPTINGFKARVYRINGSTPESLKLAWIASSYIQP
jgi:hypothetical protein